MLLGSNMDGIKYVPSLDVKPSRGKGLIGDQVHSPSAPGCLVAWAPGWSVMQLSRLESEHPALVVGHFSQEVLLRWDSCPWSLPKLHGSSTMPDMYPYSPGPDLLSWLPCLSSDLIHHYGLVQWLGMLDEAGYTHSTVGLHPLSGRSLPLLALLSHPAPLPLQGSSWLVLPGQIFYCFP